MKLTVQVVDDPYTPEGKQLLLCDEAGEPLPGQLGVRFENRMNEPATLDVTFLVDGTLVALASGVQVQPPI